MAQEVTVDLSTLSHDTANPVAEAYAKYLMATYNAPIGDQANEWLQTGIDGMLSDPATATVLEGTGTDMVETGVMIDGGTMVALGLMEPDDVDLNSIYFVPPSDGLQARFDVLGLGDMNDDIVHVYDTEQGTRRDLNIDWSGIAFGIPSVVNIADHVWEAERFVADGAKQTWRVNARARFASIPLNLFTLPGGGQVTLAILRNQEPGKARPGLIGWAVQGGVNLVMSIRSGRIHKHPTNDWARYHMVEGDVAFRSGGQIGDGAVLGEGSDAGPFDGWFAEPLGELEYRFRTYRTVTTPVGGDLVWHGSSTEILLQGLRYLTGKALGVDSVSRLDTVDFTASVGASRTKDGDFVGFANSDIRFVQIFSINPDNAPWSAAEVGLGYLGLFAAAAYQWVTAGGNLNEVFTNFLSWPLFNRSDHTPPVNGDVIPGVVSPLGTILPSANGAPTRVVADFVGWVADTVTSYGMEGVGVLPEALEMGGTAYARYAAPGVTEIVSYATNADLARVITYYSDGTVSQVFVDVDQLYRGQNDVIVDFDLDEGTVVNTVLPGGGNSPVATPWSPFNYKGRKSLYYVTYATAYTFRVTWGVNPADPEATSPFPTTPPSSPPSGPPTTGRPSVPPSIQPSPGPSGQPSPDPSGQPSDEFSGQPTVGNGG